MDLYPDRFIAGTYEDEQPDAIWIDGHADEGLAVPAFVFRRLLAIGAAYHLHYLGSVLEYDEETRLDAVQCRDLVREIEFIAEVVQDPLLKASVVPVLEVVARVSRRAPSAVLVVDLES